MSKPRSTEQLITLYRSAVEPKPAEVDALWKHVADPDAEFRIVRAAAKAAAPRRARPVVWAGGLVALAAAVLVVWWIQSIGQDAAGTEQGAPSLAPYEHEPNGATDEAALKAPSRAGDRFRPETEVTPDPELDTAPAQPREAAPATGRRPTRAAKPGPAALEVTSPGAELDPLAKETALIRRAEASLRAGDPAGALEVLQEHAAAFASGALAVERKALRVIALCRSGNTAQGRGEAALLRRHAASKPYGERIRRACEGESSFGTRAGNSEWRPDR